MDSVSITWPSQTQTGFRQRHRYSVATELVTLVAVQAEHGGRLLVHFFHLLLASDVTWNASHYNSPVYPSPRRLKRSVHVAAGVYDDYIFCKPPVFCVNFNHCYLLLCCSWVPPRALLSSSMLSCTCCWLLEYKTLSGTDSTVVRTVCDRSNHKTATHRRPDVVTLALARFS